jgi:ribosomal protein S18 acetylase RimI-like enzyme
VTDPESTPVDVEAATAEDADAVTDLWVDLADDQRRHGSHLAAGANREVAATAVAHHAVSGGLLVARDGTETVGFVMFGPESGSYEQDVERGVVRNIYVRPAFRGDGVGAALLEAAERSLAERGVDVVSLEAMADNGDARRFYERRGYREHRVEFEKELR